jgi:hypothetical protein
VCHSDVFNTFPLGTGAERYPDYRPFVKDQKTWSSPKILWKKEHALTGIRRMSGEGA